ncbi:hypothetical protein OAH18_02275 [bacterium]|nr:hypothetical protein [bacterium]
MHRTRTRIKILDEQFFYWSKAQSPQRVSEFYFKLKLACVAFAILGGAVIFSHSRYLAYKERQAQLASERELVQERRLAARQKLARERQSSVSGHATLNTADSAINNTAF